MRRLIQFTSILLILGGTILNCEKGARNLLDENEVDIEKSSSELPKIIFLNQPHPNPVSRQQDAKISSRYGLPQAMRVTLTVENVIGDVVRVLVNQQQPAGFHEVIWDTKNDAGKPVKAGVYMVHLATAAASQRKLVEIRD